MKLTEAKYPVFEANQVLTKTQLNNAVNYLHEQQRLTRANLIGIGVVCGLEIRFDSATSTLCLTKGCGIGSEGYLIVEPEDVALVAYREQAYTPPDKLPYPLFNNKQDIDNGQSPYPLWELFPEGEPDTAPLTAGFLNDKAVLLFLELKEEDLHNCSADNCDDKGAEITATVKRLLIREQDLLKLIAEANQLETGLTPEDLKSRLLTHLNLPDLRLPRYAVNDALVTSRQVLEAFQKVFQRGKLATQTGTALATAYEAFKPLIKDHYPQNPFAGFQGKFGFLDETPTGSAQVLFLQYYYGFFDDLLCAYEEFRRRGADLMCACCPPETLFPRHLILGSLNPASANLQEIFRHGFLSSAANSKCKSRTQEVIQLFRRLEVMVSSFTHTPPLPAIPRNTKVDPQIRITPSKTGNAPLAGKAIPYYYQPANHPPLFRVWNPEKTRHNKATHNLGYHADRYTPAAPEFVTAPLHYELEANNFLRIEGHLGKNYQAVLRNLLSQKSRYRLPINIIALRTGVFDERFTATTVEETCHCRDLETLYDTLREELLVTLSEGVMSLYNIKIKGGEITGGQPQLALLRRYAPNFRAVDNTVGAWYEKNLKLTQSRPYIDVNQDAISQDEVLKVYCILFSGTSDTLPAEHYPPVVAVYYLSKLSEILPASLEDLGYADFENKYEDLVSLIRYLRSEAIQNISTELQPFIPQEDLIDQFDHILFSCKLGSIRAIHQERLQRIRETKQKQFLAHFLRNNPGIQHRAGVPLGGTFILVYHEEPEHIRTSIHPPAMEELPPVRRPLFPRTDTFRHETSASLITDTFKRLRSKPDLLHDPDIRLLFAELTGEIPEIIATPAASDNIFDRTVNELESGTVIADFFLPYICCSDCAPIEFTLPKTRPTFTLEVACTDVRGRAEVTVIPARGLEPYSIKLDTQEYQPLRGILLLGSGKHVLTVRDSDGIESMPQSIEIPRPLTLGKVKYECMDNGQYIAVTRITGGTYPYTANGVALRGNTFTSRPVRNGTTLPLEVKDHQGCITTAKLRHTCEEPCNLPCEGVSRRCAYRLWLQPPAGRRGIYETYQQEKEIQFRFNDKVIDLSDTADLLQADTRQLNNKFQATIAAMLKRLNERINQALIDTLGREGKNRLLITYQPEESNPFGMFYIEHFTCDTFRIEFHYTFAKPSPAFSLSARYTNTDDFNGTLLVNRRLRNRATPVPTFQCVERNQCEGIPYQSLCKRRETIKPAIHMDPTGNNTFILAGSVDNADPKDITAWIWDFPDSQPTAPFYEGEKNVKVELHNPKGTVRLTVMTKEGCFATVTQPLPKRQ